MKFEDLNLSGELLAAIQELGHDTPMEIQSKSIPYIMDGRDVMGESATGSGKTLAFGCGIVKSVEPGQGLQGLILAPTRELAEQVKEAIRKLSNKLRIISVYGGVPINKQISELTKAEVVVATPGRLLDHLQRRTINLSRVKLLVLDEADRMLDMGFMEDVEKIIRSCPRGRQTLFFSATLSGMIGSLARRHMENPMRISATKMVDPSKLKQVYYDISRNMKISLLVHLLNEEKAGLVMIFCNTRRNTDFLAGILKKNKIDAIPIHGGLTQNKRTRTIDLFNKAKVSVLICTDVAARGLNIGNVSHIYNYDIPRDSTDYVHRIGRTARAGEEGKVINLLSKMDHDNFSRIQRDYTFEIERIEKPFLKPIIVSNERFRKKQKFGRSPFRSKYKKNKRFSSNRSSSFRNKNEGRSFKKRY